MKNIGGMYRPYKAMFQTTVDIIKKRRPHPPSTTHRHTHTAKIGDVINRTEILFWRYTRGLPSTILTMLHILVMVVVKRHRVLTVPEIKCIRLPITWYLPTHAPITSTRPCTHQVYLFKVILRYFIREYTAISPRNWPIVVGRTFPLLYIG